MVVGWSKDHRLLLKYLKGNRHTAAVAVIIITVLTYSFMTTNTCRSLYVCYSVYIEACEATICRTTI